jgi:hypothetical protein
MPNKRTKTSLIKKAKTFSVPPICISKPTGVNCSLLRYNCNGTFAGIANYGPTSLADCQFIKDAQTASYGTMIYNNPPQKVFVKEDWNKCPLPPPPFGIWNPGTVTADGANDEFTWTSGSASGSLNIYSDLYGYVASCFFGFEYRFATRTLTGETFTQLIIDESGGINVDWLEWSGGTYEAGEPPP